MDARETAQLWEGNAATWTMLARMGCDIYRNHLNTPAFLAMLPDVAGLEGLDVGCGEGYNTRQVAALGARMTALDVAPTFLREAAESEIEEPLGIRYVHASGLELPFRAEAFDFVMATMSLMDMPEQDQALREAHRVLKPGGFLQFSILHPCFSTPLFQSVRDENGEKIGVICGDYFAEEQGFVEEWIFGETPAEMRADLPKFRVPRFDRTLSWWLNTLLDAGFALERFLEPTADEETLRKCPHLADTKIVAYFLHVRCRKPM